MPDATPRPVPSPDVETAPYWEAAKAHTLKLPQCTQCGRYVFPPRPLCPRCHTDTLEWTLMSGRGTVYSFSIMRDTFMRGFTPPYVVALVELEEQAGLRLNANILECAPEDVSIGMPVVVTYEDRTEEVTLPQFRPRQGQDPSR